MNSMSRKGNCCDNAVAEKGLVKVLKTKNSTSSIDSLSHTEFLLPIFQPLVA